MSDLDSVKLKLAEALKDKIQKYWELMKSWYRRKASQNPLADSLIYPLLPDHKGRV